MARPHIETVVDLSDPQSKRRLMVSIGTLQGVYDLDIRPINPQRTSAQNRYFHGVVVQSLYEFLNDPGHGDGRRHYTRAQCKDLIVTKVMGADPVINPVTGEVIDYMRPSTKDIDVDQFSELIEGAALWLSEQFGIEVPPAQSIFQDLLNKQHATANSRERNGA